MTGKTKICGWCFIERNVTEFHLRKKNGKCRPRMECKICYRAKRREGYAQNKEKVLEINKKYIQGRSEYKKEYDKKRYNKNKTKVNNGNLIRYHKRVGYDINFRILRAMRSRIYFAVKGGKKCLKTVELVGCSIEYLKNYLESKFVTGMSWDNYGRNGWHIDHKIPCDNFDMSNDSEQKACFNYTNLQPLWQEDNLKKGNKAA